MARLLTALFAFLLCLAPAASAQTFNAQEQAEIRALVRDYLVRNPDVLREALDALQERTQSERWQAIRSDPRDFSIGPADAPIVIVEFFDYRCGYCHAALEWVTDLTRTRRDVRIVLKELPILSAQSMEASRAAIASMSQGRYWAFHQALMSERSDLTSERIDALARRSGIDVARMRRAMETPEIMELIQTNHGHALDLVPNPATPLFMINGEIVSGCNRPLLEQRLREATQDVRARR